MYASSFDSILMLKGFIGFLREELADGERKSLLEALTLICILITDLKGEDICPGIMRIQGNTVSAKLHVSSVYSEGFTEQTIVGFVVKYHVFVP